MLRTKQKIKDEKLEQKFSKVSSKPKIIKIQNSLAKKVMENAKK